MPGAARDPHLPSAARLVVRGSWPAPCLRSRFVASSHRLPPSCQELVDDAWAEALAVPGVRLFNGALCRLEGHQADAGGLLLTLSRTTYKAYLGSNVRHGEWADSHGPGALANPVGTSVALRSSDGVLVFGVRSARVALYPGHAHPFGGTMEVPEPGSEVDLIAEMARELAEEAGLARSELDELRAIALAEDCILRQPELIYAARTRLTAAAIAGRLDPEEHTACWMLPDEQAEIDRVLAGAIPVSPVLRATLLAWGAERFGDEWLAQAGGTAG
jgi:8-oxo-dGTP pyrophosphatase MutT (NUDIX family)